MSHPETGTTMEDLVPSTRVLLWSAPRSLSTVFERSVRELCGVKVVYGPFLFAYYKDFNYEGEGLQYTSSVYDNADEKLLANYDGCSALFTKNMGYFIPKERYETYAEGRFATFKHTFLIRSPLKSVPSRQKGCKKCNLPFDPVNSYFELYELFKFMQSRGKVAAVLDADDLEANPEKVMQYYCSATGLPYDKKMLSWTPGVVEDWTVFSYYKEWYWNAMFSSGFNVGIQRSASGGGPYPPAVEEQIQKEMPYYEAIYKHRTILS